MKTQELTRLVEMGVSLVSIVAKFPQRSEAGVWSRRYCVLRLLGSQARHHRYGGSNLVLRQKGSLPPDRGVRADTWLLRSLLATAIDERKPLIRIDVRHRAWKIHLCCRVASNQSNQSRRYGLIDC